MIMETDRSYAFMAIKKVKSFGMLTAKRKLIRKLV